MKKEYKYAIYAGLGLAALYLVTKIGSEVQGTTTAVSGVFTSLTGGQQPAYAPANDLPNAAINEDYIQDGPGGIARILQNAG